MKFGSTTYGRRKVAALSGFRGIWHAVLLAGCLTGVAVAQETLVIDSGTVVPSSVRQWVFEGTKVVDGPTGREITLDAASMQVDPLTDLHVSFDADSPVDRAGHWSVETVGTYEKSADYRLGGGSGAFRAPLGKLVLLPNDKTVFAPNAPLGSMSLDFWMKPARAESGEIVMLWKSTRKTGKTWQPQQVSCIVMRNRVVFSFMNFFAKPDGAPYTVSLQGLSLLVPGVWSHHMIRFSAGTGLVEYVRDGEVEAVAYATSTGRESGTVFIPQSGESSRLELAPNYSGLIDEFRMTAVARGAPRLQKFGKAGGVATSPVIDLGMTNSALLSIVPRTRVPAEAAIHWSYRIADESAGWTDDTPEWLPFAPGTELPDQGGAGTRGRYLQLCAHLYPDASGEKTPALSSIEVTYRQDVPPLPPATVSAKPGNGRVVVRWSEVKEADVAGYVVYYGLSAGNYFGTGAAEGDSPVFVPGASTTGLTLNGLVNGTLYHIAVAAYDGAAPPHIGATSREQTARPSRVTP